MKFTYHSHLADNSMSIPVCRFMHQNCCKYTCNSNSLHNFKYVIIAAILLYFRCTYVCTYATKSQTNECTLILTSHDGDSLCNKINVVNFNLQLNAQIKYIAM